MTSRNSLSFYAHLEQRITVLLLFICVIFFNGCADGYNENSATATANVAELSPAEKGEKIFGRYCFACHGPSGEGSELAPSFRDQIWIHGNTAAMVGNVISHGVPNTAMVPWKTALKKEDVEHLSQFIFSLPKDNKKSLGGNIYKSLQKLEAPHLELGQSELE